MRFRRAILALTSSGALARNAEIKRGQPEAANRRARAGVEQQQPGHTTRLTRAHRCDFVCTMATLLAILVMMPLAV